MHNLIDTLKPTIQGILKDLGVTDIPQLQWQKTRKEFEGELTLVTFALTKALGKKPEDIGELIGEKLLSSSAPVENYNVVKGFLNIKMTDEYWLAFFSGLAKTESFGFKAAKSQAPMMVEYASPNTNKPLHLGHLRNVFLGWSVANILEANGHTVKRVQIVNDRGIHICKSMYSWMQSDDKLTPESSGLKGDLLVGRYYVDFDRLYKTEVAELIAQGKTEAEAKEEAPSIQGARELLRQWEQKVPEVYELWEQMNGWVYKGWESTFEQMGVSFDQNYYESETYVLGRQVVLEGVEKGIFEQDEDGSIWIDLSEDGLDRKILQRSDGTTVYITQDIGTAIKRFEENPGLASQVYTVGNEQEYHFKVLFLVLSKLGYAWAKDCYHLSYGMVELPEGKMKTREGTVVDADDLMTDMVSTAKATTEELGKLEGLDDSSREALFEMIGLGALKYFLLKVDPRKKMLFDPSESIDFAGNTAPFIQYTHARIKSILRRYEETKPLDYSSMALHEKEREIIALLHDFPSTIEDAAVQYSPALVANYVYDLVKTFNQYYQSVPILSNDDGAAAQYFRIKLISEVSDIIARGMKLLGIGVPDQM